MFIKVKPYVCNCKQTKRTQEVIWLLHFYWEGGGCEIPTLFWQRMIRDQEWDHWHMVADVPAAPVFPPCSQKIHSFGFHLMILHCNHILSVLPCLPGVRHCCCFTQVVPWHPQWVCYCPACQESLLEKTHQDPHRVAQDFEGSRCRFPGFPPADVAVLNTRLCGCWQKVSLSLGSQGSWEVSSLPEQSFWNM